MEYLSALSIVYPYTKCSHTNTCYMFGKSDSLTFLPFKDSFESEKENIRKMYANWTNFGESKCHLPIKNAFNSRKVYDLFITVVRYSSLCIKQDALINLFNKYRVQKNPKAK